VHLRVWFFSLVLVASLSACGGGGGGGAVSTTPTPSTYTIGGSVTGLTGTLVLQDNGGDSLPRSTDGSFTFTTPLASGSPYAVSVSSQPTGQDCVVSAGSGTVASAVINNVSVICTPINYTIGGSVTDLLAGRSLVLQDNGGNSTPVAANGTFSFSTPVASGSNYAVTILTQPAGQNCAVTDGSGTVAGLDVNNVAIACSDNTYNIGVTASGVSATGLVLQDNGGDNLSISMNGTINFNAPVASGSNYAVTVLTPPLGETCTIGNGSGTIVSSNVSNVSVTCTINSYPIGGTLSGLLGGHTVVLQDNAGNSATLSANGTFSFSTPVLSGSNYAVTVLTQPSGQNCAVTNGSGIVAGSAVTNVTVACSDNTYNIGVTVSGVIRSGLVLQDNGADNLPVSINESINFNTPIASGSSYAVTILTQPAGESCLVTNGSGTVANANINIVVTCTPNTYTIGGSVSGLSGNLVLQDNGSADMLTLSANSTFTFGTPISSGASYSVSVLTQPAGQTCSILNGTGTVVAANITDVAVTCSTSNEWTWISGSNTIDATGVYGTQGAAAAGNVPGSRYYSASWTDASGNLWMFGGAVFTAGGGAQDYLHDLANDLWKFNPAAGTWTWVNGSNTINTNGVYGTQGAAAAGNVPGARYGSISWTDSSGNLWLFGGYGFDSIGSQSWLNDLWKFNPTAGTWTWVSGSKFADAFGAYGTQGIAASGNVPGSRYSSVSWTDSSGNLWLFGGSGYASSGGQGYLNDLWEFNPTAGTWMWVGGSNTINAHGVAGTQGTASTGNVPGATYAASSWTDLSGNLWLFGGYGFNSAGQQGSLNDLWEYNRTAGTWNWVSGSSAINAAGVYGTLGSASAGNVPGSRYSSTSWTDSSGNLWLFGGYGFDSGNTFAFLNDLWKFNPTAGTWTWIGGSKLVQADGIYGTEGTPASSNVPGARFSALQWTDLSGNFWLFGGYGFDSAGSSDTLNDLWKYVP
jgi:N-acetylneuraminic acid mutarotase